MTVDEKIGQLNLPPVGFDGTGPILSQGVDEKIEKGLVGGVLIPLPGCSTEASGPGYAKIKVKDSAVVWL